MNQIRVCAAVDDDHGRSQIQVGSAGSGRSVLSLLSRLLVFACCLGAVATTGFRPLFAQDLADSGVQQISRTSAIQEFRSGSWNTRRVEIRNHNQHDEDLITGGHFSGAPGQVFTRRVTVPARAKLAIDVPVFPPAVDDSLEWNAFLCRQDDQQTLLKIAGNYRIETERVPSTSDVVTAVISDFESDAGEQQARCRELAVVLRLDRGLDRRVSHVNLRSLPDGPGAFDTVDQVLLATSRIADFPGVLNRLRSWVEQGGQLWIPLDVVSASTVERLLGDVLQLSVIDQCALTHVSLIKHKTGDQAGESRTFDYPVTLVRTMADGARILHTVDDWPASYGASVGLGRVVLTALSSEAWVRDRTDEDPRLSLDRYSNWMPIPALTDLGDEWSTQYSEQPLSTDHMAAFLTEEIGYEVPGRGQVFAILLTGWMLLLLLGGWLLRGQTQTHAIRSGDSPRTPGAAARSLRRPELLAVLSPVLAVLTAAPVVWLGSTAHDAVPAGASQLEFAEVSPATNSVSTDGIALVWSPDQHNGLVSGQQGRLIRTIGQTAVDGSRETRWLNSEDWRIEHFDFPTGQLSLATSSERKLSVAVNAVATFGPQGLQATVNSGPFADPVDALIATECDGVLPVTISGSGEFSAAVDDVREPGAWLSDLLVSDLQSRRQKIYQQLLTPTDRFRYPARPTLLAWVVPQNGGLQLPSRLEHRCSTLLSVPLEFQAPTPGSEVRIPSPFLPFELRQHNGNVGTSVWNPRTRQWQPGSYQTDALLRFRIPQVLWPLTLTEAQLQMRILAPDRTLTVRHGNSQDGEPIDVVDSPSGSLSWTIDAADHLICTADGGYEISLSISKPDSASEADSIGADLTWSIDYVRLQLSGITSARASDGEGKSE